MKEDEDGLAGTARPRWEGAIVAPTARPIAQTPWNDAGPPMLYGDAARAALMRGVDQLVALLAPTLGPVPRSVAVGQIVGSDPPEVLDDAATIARRMIELPDSFENAGAMLIRGVVGDVNSDHAGDISQPVFQPLEYFPADLIVLPKSYDSSSGIGRLYVVGVNASLFSKRRLPAHCPRKQR